MGYFEVHPVYGHLGCMEFMVQPTRSELIKQVGYFNEKNFKYVFIYGKYVNNLRRACI